MEFEREKHKQERVTLTVDLDCTVLERIDRFLAFLEGKISLDDQRLLDGLLAREREIVAKLEKLDSQTG